MLAPLALLLFSACSAFAEVKDPAALAQAMETAFAPNSGTEIVYVQVDGKKVFERYAEGYTAAMPHRGWSMAKSFATALVQLAEADGYLKSGDSVAAFFPRAKGTVWEAVTLEHLMTMSSGIAWSETYEAAPFQSHVVAQLYRNAPLQDRAAYRLSQRKREFPPGKRFNYSSGDTNLLMACLRVALDRKGVDYAAYPWKRLFGPLGATSYAMERDEAGNFTASSYIYATAADYARFGQLFLQDGMWEGKRLLPASIVAHAREPGPPFSEIALDANPKDSPYSWGWWLNGPVPRAQIGKVVGSAPSDAYWAEGHEGQLIVVVPSWKLVLVRLGLNKHGKRMDLEQVFAKLAEAVGGKAGTGR